MLNKKPKIKFTGERLVPELNCGYAFFYEHLARYLFSTQLTKNKTVLDAGCGVGYGSFLVATRGGAKKVFAVDISAEAISYANQKYPNSNLIFSQSDVEMLDGVEDNSIDVALAFEIIEHVKNPHKFMMSLKDKLKKDGILIVSTPNKYTYPKGNPYHIKEYYPREFTKILKSFFGNIKVFHQCFELSQNIKEDSDTNFKFEEDFLENTQRVLTPKLDIKDSQYLLAVCSDVPIPALTAVSVNSLMVDGFNLKNGILSLLKQYQSLKDQIQKLSEQAKVSQQLVSNLENELKEIKSSKMYKIRQIFHDIKNFF